MTRHACWLAALWCVASGAAADELLQDAELIWREPVQGFGSYSGLVVSDAGDRFVTISDKGTFAVGRLIREAGKLVDVELISAGPLLDPEGQPVRRFDIDAEGLTLGLDGRLYVSFEANHRVWAYADLSKAADPLPGHKDFPKLQNNSSLEALFTAANGDLRTIPERSGKQSRPFPIYSYGNGQWGFAGAVPRSGPWLVTGADLGPDGRLYIVERDFTPLLGFATRIRSFALSDSGVSDERVLLTSSKAEYDNLEGISAWQDGDGRIRLTLISDDNNSIFQKTQLVEFIVIK